MGVDMLRGGLRNNSYIGWRTL